MSRFSRANARTRTITGVTSVGGSSSTVVSITADANITFTDRFGRVVRVPIRGRVPGNYIPVDFNTDPILLLVDALIART